MNGLRGFAAYIVFVSHFTNQTGFLDGTLGHGAGQLGVMLFFALSGFLMGHLYFYRSADTSEIGRFFQRRAARVLPLYFLVVLASFALPHWLYPVDSAGRLAEHLLMVKGVSVLWTIPVEVQFYALFPLFWIVAARFGRVTISVLCVALIIWFYLDPPSKPHQLSSHAHFFLAGMLTAVAAPLVTIRGIRADAAFVVSIGCLMFLVPGILQFLTGIQFEKPARAVWANPLYLICCMSVLLCSIRSPLAKRLLGSGPVAFLGTISYSLYLLHLPVLFAITSSGIAESNALLFLIANIVVIAVATTSYYCVEKPAQCWLNSITTRRQPYTVR